MRNPLPISTGLIASLLRSATHSEEQRQVVHLGRPNPSQLLAAEVSVAGLKGSCDFYSVILHAKDRSFLELSKAVPNVPDTACAHASLKVSASQAVPFATSMKSRDHFPSRKHAKLVCMAVEFVDARDSAARDRAEGLHVRLEPKGWLALLKIQIVPAMSWRSSKEGAKIRLTNADQKGPE